LAVLPAQRTWHAPQQLVDLHQRCFVKLHFSMQRLPLIST
jgi:hypothetical protein